MAPVGSATSFYVRPHELEIDRLPHNGGMPAEVLHINPAGPVIRVQLTAVATSVPILVELTRERLRVITRLAEPDPSRLTLGQPMRLVADTLPGEDGDVVTWAFEAAQ